MRSWIESVFLKRAVLATVAAACAQLAAHQASVVQHLSAWGVNATLHIDQQVLANHLTIVLVGLSQGLHEWIVDKYPSAGKYL